MRFQPRIDFLLVRPDCFLKWYSSIDTKSREDPDSVRVISAFCVEQESFHGSTCGSKSIRKMKRPPALVCRAARRPRARAGGC